ncbi:MAG: hypothetical protein H7Y38_18450, partial [Armatimonadetes bacterium]|nr:hypothetical protein [Armatimonadota bacterium]
MITSPEVEPTAEPQSPRTAPPTTRPDDAFRHGFFFTLGLATVALILFATWKTLDAVMAIAA